MPFNTFANRADPDQAVVARADQAALVSGSTLFAYVYMVRCDPTLVDLTSNFFACSMYKRESLLI